MTTSITSINLSRSQAQEAAVTCLEILQRFMRELDRIYPSFNKGFAVVELGQLRLRVQRILRPLLFQSEVDIALHHVIDEIIHTKPAISSKLQTFWDAHIEMSAMSASSSQLYDPMKYANENREKILRVDQRHFEVSRRFAQNRDDEVSLYALFYVFMLKIDVIEYSFLKQFKELLQDFNLQSKYDAEEIFSAISKIQKGTTWNTDGRAVRDALGHNKFELEFSGGTWKIEFKNDERGYNFNKIFTKDEFTQFFNNTDMLHRSSLMLIFVIIASTIIKQHFVTEKP